MEDESVFVSLPISSDLRRYPRYRIPLTVLVQPGKAASEESRSEWQTARLQNISLTGFYFISAHSYAEGSFLGVQIVLEDRSYRVQALVQRSEAIQDDIDRNAGYRIAALFLRGGDVLAFLPALATYLNRRPHARLPEDRGMCAECVPFGV